MYGYYYICFQDVYKKTCIQCLYCNIMAEGFRFMPLGLVRLRAFRLSAWVTWVQHWCRCSRVGGVDMSLRGVTVAQMGGRTSECEWRRTPEAHGEFWEFWRKLVELKTGHQTGRVNFRLLAEALGRCRTRWGADEKASIERMCVSLLMLKKL